MDIGSHRSDRKGEYRKELAEAYRQGFEGSNRRHNQRAWSRNLLGRYEKHTIELCLSGVVSTTKTAIGSRKASRSAITMTGGEISLLSGNSTEDAEHRLLSSRRACPIHGIAAPELEPRLFSFNAPQGMCTTCNGIDIWRVLIRRA